MGGGNGDDFRHVGPQYLTCIDWLNSNHRTAVASSLVQGVYSLQRDKIEKREAVANRWWESIDFSLVEPLTNENDNSIYGAVFEYENYKSIPHSGMAPRFVIAFRGTMLKYKTWYKDVSDGSRCLFNNLNKGNRYKRALETIETLLKTYKTDDETVSIWLAGHSLGAAIALLAGKTMAKLGFPLTTYAFNPPNSSFPIEKLCDSDVFKCLFRITDSFIKMTIAVLFDLPTQQHDPRLAEWVPYVYVNPEDIICAEYFGDLKHKTRMACIGLSKFESVGAGIKIKSIVFGIEEGEPIQHLLSADITVNMNEPNVETPHGLAQWWGNPALRSNWETFSIRP